MTSAKMARAEKTKQDLRSEATRQRLVAAARGLFAERGYADGATDQTAALHAGVRRFLEVCADPAVERIILLDAPAVLGWQAWRDLADRYGLGLLQHALQAAIDAGAITPQPIVPLAHVLIGALNECALYVARGDDPAAARQECTAILQQLLDGLTPRAGQRP